jgi:hypothetical protein
MICEHREGLCNHPREFLRLLDSSFQRSFQVIQHPLLIRPQYIIYNLIALCVRFLYKYLPNTLPGTKGQNL